MRIIFIIIILFFFIPVIAQQKKLVYDSSQVHQRHFTASSLKTYTNDENFQYQKEAVETPSAWDRFWQWFWNKYNEIMSTEAGRATMKIIYWLLGIAAVAFFVAKVMNMNRINLFAPASPGNNAYTIEDENIYAISFDEAIQQALQEGNYRLAIRLLYLQNLKILADKNFIVWQPNKTDTDYLREINKPGLQQLFKNITDIFEYVWYGNLVVVKEDFTEIKEDFSRFQNQL
ncbi:MAG TPA: DUF4129 domain-containing protein [Chitinophagaceae bacterium]|nr:DUF4129 domain-containing protein [Chitinophagaceae bacterium]